MSNLHETAAIGRRRYRLLALLLGLAIAAAVTGLVFLPRGMVDGPDTGAGHAVVPRPATIPDQTDQQPQEAPAEALDPADLLDMLLTMIANDQHDACRDKLLWYPNLNALSARPATRGKTLMHLSAERGQLKLVQILLSCGAWTDVTDLDGRTALDLAVASEPADAAMVCLLLGADADGDARSIYKAVDIALAGGQADAARGYLDRMVNIDGKRDDKGKGLIHFASMYANRGVAELLLARKVSVHVTDWEGSRPLHLAVGAGKSADAVVALLLDAGADANEPDLMDRSPLYLAAGAGASLRVLKLLLDGGARPNRHGDRGLSPLLLAAGRRDYESVRLLLEDGADPNIQDGEGKTALHYAGLAGDMKLVEIMLTAGASTRMRDNSRMLARVYALNKGFPQINELILRVEAERAEARDRAAATQQD